MQDVQSTHQKDWFFGVMSVVCAEDDLSVIYLLELNQFPRYLACWHLSLVAYKSTVINFWLSSILLFSYRGFL